jgi:hypothetical protein
VIFLSQRNHVAISLFWIKEVWDDGGGGFGAGVEIEERSVEFIRWILIRDILMLMLEGVNPQVEGEQAERRIVDVVIAGVALGVHLFVDVEVASGRRAAAVEEIPLHVAGESLGIGEIACPSAQIDAGYGNFDQHREQDNAK